MFGQGTQLPMVIIIAKSFLDTVLDIFEEKPLPSELLNPEEREKVRKEKEKRKGYLFVLTLVGGVLYLGWLRK